MGSPDAVRKREQGSIDYAQSLKAFLFFLRYGIKPTGVSDADFELYKPVCVALVEKGQFKPSVLKMFDD